MTNYNKRLDKILEQAYTDGASDTMWQNDRHVEIFATAKQAIKQLIASELNERLNAHYEPELKTYDYDGIAESMIEWLGELGGGDDQL